MEYNLKFPMFDSPGFKMAGGLSYYTEEFNFRASDTVGNGMYQNLNDRDLRSLGFALYALKPFRSQYFLGARAGVQWNGDFERVRDDLDTDRNFLKWTAAAVFGKKPRDWTEFGFGAAISYDFGRPSIYPVLFYNHNFNQRWGFESLLPVNAKIRYNYGPQTIFHLAADLQGTSFHVRIADSVLRDINTLEMRKSEIRWQLVWNQAIKDPLWFSVAAGYRRNFTFKLAESNDPRGNIIYRNSVSGAFFFNIELYIVPPDELIDKWRRKRALKKLEK